MQIYLFLQILFFVLFFLDSILMVQLHFITQKDNIFFCLFIFSGFCVFMIYYNCIIKNGGNQKNG